MSYPASTTRTCTSRPGRSRKTRCGWRDAVARGDAGSASPPLRSDVPPGRWLRGTGLAERRLVADGRADEGGARPRHRRRADRPDGARLPLALAQLGGARATPTASSRSPAASSSATRSGEPTGVLREECAWHFRDTLRAPDRGRDRRGDARWAPDRQRARRDRRARQGRLARSARRLAAAPRRGLALPARLAVPAGTTRSTELAAVDLRSGFGDDLVRIGYLKAFMDGTLGSQTARMLDGSGVEITSREELDGDHPRAAQRRASPSPSTRSATSRTARRSTRSRRPGTRGRPVGLRPRIEHAQLLAPEDVARFARARRRRFRAVQPRPLRPRPRRPLLGRQDRRRLRVPLALGRRRARRERLGRADRGARPVGRDLRRRPAHDRRARIVASRAAPEPRRSAARDDGGRPPGWPATRIGAASCSPATSPISSSSTGTRSRSRSRSFPRPAWSRRCSADAGRTTPLPGTSGRAGAVMFSAGFTARRRRPGWKLAPSLNPSTTCGSTRSACRRSLFQSITHMAPAAAVAYSIYISVPYSRQALAAVGRCSR